MALLTDLLIVLGLLLTTLGVVGIYRMPDVYTQLHASGKAAFLGTLAFLGAGALAGNAAVDAKALLIALFLVLTAPVAAHVIARASYARGEQMATPGAVDETRPRPRLVSGAMSATAPKLPEGIEACLFDLDGVLTETAKVHAKAWKRMFDVYLAERSERGEGGELREFDAGEDYNEYVDGRPRYDGVRSFLASRGIELPEGDPGDPPGRETVRGLGNRKNELVMEILRHDGVEAYPGSVRFVEAARDAGLRRAVVSSSANCQEVLRAAGIEALFEERIDGHVAAEQGLAGKPAPDTYLAAARALGVEPGAATVFEDAVSGVEAGSAGGFGYVVGVDRVDHAGALREHGASVVVRDLAELLPEAA